MPNEGAIDLCYYIILFTLWKDIAIGTQLLQSGYSLIYILIVAFIKNNYRGLAIKQCLLGDYILEQGQQLSSSCPWLGRLVSRFACPGHCPSGAEGWSDRCLAFAGSTVGVRLAQRCLRRMDQLAVRDGPCHEELRRIESAASGLPSGSSCPSPICRPGTRWGLFDRQSACTGSCSRLGYARTPAAGTAFAGCFFGCGSSSYLSSVGSVSL